MTRDAGRGTRDAGCSRYSEIGTRNSGLTPRPASRLPRPAPKATFVLIAGSFCGGWVWRDTARALRAAGHEVHTPTLTGLGERVHLVRPDIDLELWVSDLVNVLEFEDLHGVILTAWGFGGMVITPAADRVPDRVSRLVYINAYVPRAGQATIHLYPPAWLDLVDEAHGLHQAGGAWLLPPPDADYLRDFVPDDARRHWFAGKLTAHPMRTVTQPVRLENAALASIPRTYLHCLKGAYGPLGPHIALIQPWFEALPGWEFRDVPLTYFAPVNDPLGVAAELERLVSVAVGDRA